MRNDANELDAVWSDELKKELGAVVDKHLAVHNLAKAGDRTDHHRDANSMVKPNQGAEVREESNKFRRALFGIFWSVTAVITAYLLILGFMLFLMYLATFGDIAQAYGADCARELTASYLLASLDGAELIPAFLDIQEPVVPPECTEPLTLSEYIDQYSDR